MQLYAVKWNPMAGGDRKRAACFDLQFYSVTRTRTPHEVSSDSRQDAAAVA